MIPGSQALLISIFPPDKRGTALGIWSMTTLVAPICGPILGGYISDNYHWSWIFLINRAGRCRLRVSVLAQPAHARDADAQACRSTASGLGLLVDLGRLAAGHARHRARTPTGSHSTADRDPGGHRRIDRLRRLADLGTDRAASRSSISPCSRSATSRSGRSPSVSAMRSSSAQPALLPLWLQTQLGYTATWAGLVAAPSGVVAVLLTPFAARVMAPRRRALGRNRRIRRLRDLLFPARRLLRPMQASDLSFCRCWCRASR